MRKQITNLLTALVLLVCQSSFAQTMVSGKITDAASQEPLFGTNVLVKGTTRGTMTDIDGSFEIEMPEGKTILEIQMIGYKSQELDVSGKSSIDIALEEDVVGVEEVTVVGMGLTTEKRRLGYAVQDVKGDDISAAKEQNVISALSGKVAGVNITNASGQVGASAAIQLRGPKSISGTSQPLFVVDGVPMDNTYYGSNNGFGGFDYGNPISDINQDDIESISVLKGPNAAAIYGSRAQNGVIVITTKSGSGASKGLGINYSFSGSTERPLVLPDYQNEYGQGVDGNFSYVDGNGGGVNDGLDYSYGPKLDAGEQVVQWWSNGQPADWKSNPDNVKSFFRNGTTMSHNISVTAGGEKANARFSYNNFRQNGTVPNTNMKRDVINARTQMNLSDKLSLEVKGTYNRTVSDNRTANGYGIGNPLQQLVWSARQIDMQKLKDNYIDEEGRPSNWNSAFHENPYWIVNKNVNPMERDRISGFVKMNYKINDWIDIQGRVGTDWYKELRQNIMAMHSITDNDGSFYEAVLFNTEINKDLLVTMDRDLSADINMNASFGVNRMDRKYSTKTVNISALSTPDLYSYNNAAAEPAVGYLNTNKRLNSVFGNVNLNYKNFLSLDITGRNDWSSALPLDNNSYFYPGVNLSFIFTELLSDNMPDWFDYGKLRGGYAKVGKDMAPHNLVATYTGTSLPINNIVPFTASATLFNKDLVPEMTSSVEFGAEFKFFGNRLGIDATYYDESTVDQIIAIPVNPASGFGSKFVNAGEVTNKGVELLINGTLFDGGDDGFSWSMDINFAKNTNNIAKLPEEVNGQYKLVNTDFWDLTLLAIEGQPKGTLFAPGTNRHSNGEVIHSNYWARDEAGAWLQFPWTPTVTPAKPLGNVQPDWRGGWKNTFSYKGVTLGALIDVKWGGDIWVGTYAHGMQSGIIEESLVGRENGLTITGVLADGTPVSTDIPGTDPYLAEDLSWDMDVHGYYGWTYWYDIERSIFDASYIKLREFTLGYDIPVKNMLNGAIKGLSVGVFGRNVAILYTEVPHIDPEVSLGVGSPFEGIEFGATPSNRQFGLTLNAKL